MTVVRVAAPAKLNLGLEVLGRRPDGYHEIRSVLAMINLVDTVTVTGATDGKNRRRGGPPGVRCEDDLALRALDLLQQATPYPVAATVDVQKRIPAGAGLGGGSANAAATLLASKMVWQLPPDLPLSPLAEQLGTDVPFFLAGPCALASGTGTTLQALPPLPSWAVIASPPLTLLRKTATLYSALRSEDLSDGTMVLRAVESVTAGKPPPPAALYNSFERPLYSIAPELARFRELFLSADAPFAALSGAGGSHYTLVAEHAQAQWIGERLRERLPRDVYVHVASLRAIGLHPELVSSPDGTHVA